MANFATVADVAAFLQVGISTPEQSAAAARALKEATSAIRSHCRQFISFYADDVVVLDSNGGSRLFLPELPVVEITAVIENGVTLTADIDYQLGQHGILHRVGAKWVRGIQAVQVVYSHGYETLPDAIVAVATRAASRAYQSGLRAAGDEALLGVQSKSLGDFSVAYTSESGGGVGEGVMGASAARMLLMSEKDILNEFRV